MKSQRQPSSPPTPPIPSKIPAASKPETAVARTSPEYKNAYLKASSLFVYQQDSRKKTPGKKGASQIPRKKRTATS
jgi:hypothetical protein